MPNLGRVRFAEFSFDASSGELWRGEQQVPLEHQPSLVLRRLVTSPGQVVLREDLAALLWPSGTHVKFDDGLNYCIRQIRVALGDESKSPRFIVTLPRRGYRFIGAVEPESAGAWRRWRPAAATAFAALCCLVAIAEARPNNHHEMAVSIARSIHDLIF